MTPMIQHSDLTSYPGWYTPSVEISAILRHIDHLPARKFRRLSVKLNQFAHHYQILLPVLNTAKEDIVVYTHEGQLVIALKKLLPERRRSSRSKPYEYSCAAISLPEDADAEFSSAECKGGNLQICLSKITNRQRGADHQILVY